MTYAVLRTLLTGCPPTLSATPDSRLKVRYKIHLIYKFLELKAILKVCIVVSVWVFTFNWSCDYLFVSFSKWLFAVSIYSCWTLFVKLLDYFACFYASLLMLAGPFRWMSQINNHISLQLWIHNIKRRRWGITATYKHFQLHFKLYSIRQK